jgi:hypothetical protein
LLDSRGVHEDRFLAVSVTIEEMRELVGVRFPGGTFTIESWENALLCEVMECEPLPDGLAHPVYLFHAPLAGVGFTYSEIFDLCRAESDEAIRAGEYDWTIHRPLRVGHTYRMSGEFIGVERKRGRRAGRMDVVTFRIDVHEADVESPVAWVINSWIFLRSE